MHGVIASFKTEQPIEYYCQGDKYYGKTKKGQYMTDGDAKAKGFHGDHGKVCTK